MGAPHVQVLLIKKLKGAGIILAAAKHNHRELQADMGSERHIDPARSQLNYVLRGADTACQVAAHTKALMLAAGVTKLRKDAVLGIEIIVSLPPASGKDETAFFAAATQWVADHYKGEIVSAVVHLDEDAPHVHILVLPLVDGRMVGSSMVGAYRHVQEAFYQQVGQQFGLGRAAKKKPLAEAVRRHAVKEAFAVLNEHSGLSAPVLEVLLAPHLSDPGPLLTVLNLRIPHTVKAPTAPIAVMAAPCLTEQPKLDKAKPMGFDGAAGTAIDQTLCSVGFGKPTQPQPAKRLPANVDKGAATPFALDADAVAHSDPADAEASSEVDDEWVRERDEERSSETWDCETGSWWAG